VAGIILFFFGLLLHLAGMWCSNRNCRGGFLPGAYGLTGLAWGRHWLKASFFPYFLLAFCVPTGGLLDGFTFKLRLLCPGCGGGGTWAGAGPDPRGHAAFLTASGRSPTKCGGVQRHPQRHGTADPDDDLWFVAFKSPWRARDDAGSAAAGGAGQRGAAVLHHRRAEMFGQDAGKMVETNSACHLRGGPGCAYLLARWLRRARRRPGEPQATLT